MCVRLLKMLRNIAMFKREATSHIFLGGDGGDRPQTSKQINKVIFYHDLCTEMQGDGVGRG